MLTYWLRCGHNGAERAAGGQIGRVGMSKIETDVVAEVLGRVRESDPRPVLGAGPPTDAEHAAFRQGVTMAWSMITFGLADAMLADHPRWDRDRFYDLADGVTV